MACEVVSHGRVVLVVWGTPQLRDIRRVEDKVQRVYKEFGPVIFIARVPPNAEPPEAHVRDAVVRMLGQFTEKCSSYHAVFEGGGLIAATKRTVLAAMFLMTGNRKRYYVHAGCNDVTAAVENKYVADVWNALRAFRARHLLMHELHSLPEQSVRTYH